MTNLEMMLLLHEGVPEETLRRVQIATKLARVVQSADNSVSQAMAWQESNNADGLGATKRALELAEKLGRMF